MKLSEQDLKEMFDRAGQLCRTFQAWVNEDETPELALVMALHMLSIGYAPQIEDWNELNIVVAEMTLKAKYAKEEVN